MQIMLQRWVVLSVAGLLCGGGLGAWRHGKASSSSEASTVVVRWDEKVFQQSTDIDAVRMIAQQLPGADAQQCAALAQAMLSKRVRVAVRGDFDSDSSAVRYEEQPLSSHAWEGLFKRWMQVDAQAAWAFVEKHQSEELPLRIAALKQWALLDPLAAVKAAGEGISAEEKWAILAACREERSQIGLHYCVEWDVAITPSHINNPSAYTGSDLLRELLQKYAEESPREALDFCQAHYPPLVGEVCAGWMRKDAAACLEWMSGQPVNAQREILKTLTVQPDVSADAVRRFVALREPGEDCDAFEPGLASIARRNAPLAQSLIDELFPNPIDRILLREQVVAAFASADPRRALEFLMPSLREPLPINHGPPLPQKIAPGGVYQQSPGFGEASRYLDNFLILGPQAGVTKEEVLRLMNDIHPQHRPWMMDGNAENLLKILGRPAEWMPKLCEGISRDDVIKLLYGLDISSAQEMVEEMQATPASAVRDAMAEYALEMMLDERQPVEMVVERAKEWGGEQDWSGIYDAWLKKSPEQVMDHLMGRADASSNEWQKVIDGTYATHAEVLERAVEQMPHGKIRESAVESLSDAAMSQNMDVVTSLYWATEIRNRDQRQRLMRNLWDRWQDEESHASDPKVIEGVRQNIENSQLDAAEKRRWLERLESEVLR